jgi:branched-chain amino acid transport system ATP-binding protein
MTTHSTHAPNTMLGARATLQWSEGQLAALEVLEDHLPEQVKSGAVLEAVGISKTFGGLQALSGAGLTIEAARTTGLIGPNGAGKSTFFDCVTGFTAPDTGSVHAFGHDVTTRSPWKRAEIGMARTFQANHIAPGLSVEENLLIGAHLTLSGGLVQNALRVGRSYRNERTARGLASAVARLLDMDRYLGVRAGVLDFGAQRRIEIGRALLGPARIILLDEPTAGVDAVEAARLLGLIKQLQVDLGLAVLIIEHHVRSVLRMCDQIYVLERGQMIFSGAPNEVRENERVRAAYLGDASAL